MLHTGWISSPWVVNLKNGFLKTNTHILSCYVREISLIVFLKTFCKLCHWTTFYVLVLVPKLCLHDRCFIFTCRGNQTFLFFITPYLIVFIISTPGIFTLHQSFCFPVEEFCVILMILLTHGVCSVACASVSIALFLVQFWPQPSPLCLALKVCWWQAHTL